MLTEFHIEATRKTPSVSLKPEGEITMEGRSIPEDANIFFDDIMAWIDQYLTVPRETTVVNFSLEYLNSGTSKYVLQILKRLKELASKGHRLIINWYYEEGDDDIFERGEYYSAILDLKINYIEVE